MQQPILLMMVLTVIKCQHSAKYLQNAIRDLRQLNIQSLRRADIAQLSSHIDKEPDTFARDPYKGRHGEELHVPPLTLTKGELASLYENAVSSGKTVKLNAGDNNLILAAVHQLNEEGSEDTEEEPLHEDKNGYYYYYYPIKSFLDEMTSQAETSNDYSYLKPTRMPLTTQKPHYQFHSHHHQHNITINKAGVEEKKSGKALEPLFMAISGFIGMAVMLVFSVVFMSSKFSKVSSKPAKHRDWSVKHNEIDDFARLALNALDGQCAERFACELNKTARNFKIQDNRFIKLLKRFAPSSFGKHMDHAEKYTKKIKCTAIPCKRKNSNTNVKNQKNTKKKNIPKKKN